MPIGAEEAYQMFSRIPEPGGDQALTQLNRNTDRSRETQRWLAEENVANEQQKWANLKDAYKTGIDSYDKAKERGYRSERDKVADTRADEQLGMERQRFGMESERTRGLMDDEKRQREWDTGTEEGQTQTRAQRRMEANLQSELQRPTIEKTNAELNAQATRSSMAANSAQIRNLEEQNRTAKEDRLLGKAATRYGAALKANDLRKVAELDAEYGKELGSGGIEQAKQKARADASQAQMVQDINLRGTQVGSQAIQEIAQANADATQLSQVVNDALDYIKATPGSGEADSAKKRVLSSLPETDAEYVRSGGGIGVAGYNVDTSGVSRPQDRMVNTLQRIRTDLVKKVDTLKNQYGSLPSTEIQQGIGNLEQAIQKIDMGLNQQKKNGVQLIGGSAPGPSNADFFKGRGPTPQGNALPPIVPAAAGPGGAPMMPAPSMRNSQINRQMPAAGAAK